VTLEMFTDGAPVSPPSQQRALKCTATQDPRYGQEKMSGQTLCGGSSRVPEMPNGVALLVALRSARKAKYQSVSRPSIGGPGGRRQILLCQFHLGTEGALAVAIGNPLRPPVDPEFRLQMPCGFCGRARSDPGTARRCYQYNPSHGDGSLGGVLGEDQSAKSQACDSFPWPSPRGAQMIAVKSVLTQ